VVGSELQIFKYKTIKGPLHKLPALLKLVSLLPLSVFCMSLSPLWLSVGIMTAIILAFLCRFTLREQLTDLKPALYYAFLMYVLSVFSNLYKASFEIKNFEILIPPIEYTRISLRLVLIIQLSALLFRSTSAMEIRDSLRAVLPGRIAENISLFLSFIPQIFQTWAIINLAWKARGGRKGFSGIKTIVFILISLSMEKAAVKSRALAARS
jgi:biotin transport system permease protein/energy-coupling factor transport system permease protein